jgi:alkanesulfonate monooxygenase SsuD/methylene tetrahydromethanopterin reductase-like flavin-dependent oxidoreductase (luciferase family)
VELGAFTIVDEYPTPKGETRDRYAEAISLAEGCEEAELSSLWVAEHHFHPGGTCPSPPVLLAAMGQRTKNLRLGVMVSVLPFHNPIEVAEQYAMVDRLTGGRLNLGVGSGYIPLEFQGFGVDPGSKRERFDGALDVLLRAFRGEPIEVPGPSGGRVTLNVRPVQSPHPPLTIAVQRREALPFVARRGFSVALVPYATVASIDELADEIREFRSHLPPGSPARVAAALHLYAGDDPGSARAAFQRFLDSRLATQSTFYQAKVRRDPHHARAETIEDGGFALFGSAREVAERLGAYRDAGVDEVLGIFDFGVLPLRAVQGSVAALGRLLHPSPGAPSPRSA